MKVMLIVVLFAVVVSSITGFIIGLPMPTVVRRLSLARCTLPRISMARYTQGMGIHMTTDMFQDMLKLKDDLIQAKDEMIQKLSEAKDEMIQKLSEAKDETIVSKDEMIQKLSEAKDETIKANDKTIVSKDEMIKKLSEAKDETIKANDKTIVSKDETIKKLSEANDKTIVAKDESILHLKERLSKEIADNLSHQGLLTSRSIFEMYLQSCYNECKHSGQKISKRFNVSEFISYFYENKSDLKRNLQASSSKFSLALLNYFDNNRIDLVAFYHKLSKKIHGHPWNPDSIRVVREDLNDDEIKFIEFVLRELGLNYEGGEEAFLSNS